MASTPQQLIVSCYFALTTLSTVGYGDMFPISSTERITMVIVMLSGVAFFSYIMSNFIEIIAEYNRKTGPVDRSGTLDHWMIELQRFNNKTPLGASLVEDIYTNQNYFWSNNKFECLNEEDIEFRAIPEDIKI